MGPARLGGRAVGLLQVLSEQVLPRPSRERCLCTGFLPLSAEFSFGAAAVVMDRHHHQHVLVMRPHRQLRYMLKRGAVRKSDLGGEVLCCELVCCCHLRLQGPNSIIQLRLFTLQDTHPHLAGQTCSIRV